MERDLHVKQKSQQCLLSLQQRLQGARALIDHSSQRVGLDLDELRVLFQHRMVLDEFERFENVHESV